MKHLIIVNPTAGKGKALQAVEKIKKILQESGEYFKVELTERPGHATEIARKYASEDTYRIYSVGGDGTLNEVLNGFVGSSSSLAVIPSGTGNDFIKTLSSCSNLDEIIVNTVNGTEKKVDVAKINDRYYVNISSMGIDAEVTHNTVRFKKLPFVKGIAAYLMGLFYTLVKFKSYSLKIDIDGNVFNSEAMLFIVANGRFYGGGMKPAPEAEINDGLLDICLAGKMSKLKVLRVFPMLIKGTHGKIKEVSFYRGKYIKVVSDNDIKINIDGEVISEKVVVFEVIRQGIDIVMPKEGGN